MENTQFPKANIGDPANAQELFLRDFDFINYHINHDKWDLIRDLDIINAHRFEEDFCCDELSSCWIETKEEHGSGAAMAVCPDMVNGILYMMTDNADHDSYELVQDCECWKLVLNYPLYAEIRFALTDPVQSEFWFGLINHDHYFPVYSPTDFVTFDIDDEDNELDFHTCKNSAQTMNLALTLITPYTWYRIGFHWDGAGTVRWFVFRDGDAPQYCISTGQVTADIPDDETLALGFGLRNGEADSKGLFVDYVKCTQLRVIETFGFYQ
jgi:hypothetical protein